MDMAYFLKLIWKEPYSYKWYLFVGLNLSIYLSTDLHIYSCRLTHSI